MQATTRALRSVIATVALVMASGGPVQAALLTFEDVPGGSLQNSVGHMPTYQGFNFSFTLDWIDVGGPSWPYGANTGAFALLNNNGGVGVITEATGADFTFGGLWARQWGVPANAGPDVLFGVLEGYKDGVQVWSVPTGLHGSYEFYGPQAGLIDELRLGFGNHFLVDDLELNGVGVPEPSSFVVLALGACVVGGARRRRSAQRARA